LTNLQNISRFVILDNALDENIGKDSEGLWIRLSNPKFTDCHKSYANLKKIGYLDLLAG
jgi:hypothetical protein